MPSRRGSPRSSRDLPSRPGPRAYRLAHRAHPCDQDDGSGSPLDVPDRGHSTDLGTADVDRVASCGCRSSGRAPLRRSNSTGSRTSTATTSKCPTRTDLPTDTVAPSGPRIAGPPRRHGFPISVHLNRADDLRPGRPHLIPTTAAGLVVDLRNGSNGHSTTCSSGIAPRSPSSGRCSSTLRDMADPERN